MKYRNLGTTNLECSEIGLGTWALGSGVYGEVDHRDARNLIAGALDSGINFFDTAPLYGDTSRDGVAESVLGEALGKRREEVIVSTKFGRTARKVMPGRFYGTEARASCEASLKRLGRDWIDLLFFHSPFSPEEICDDVWEELQRLREEGKIRYVGHSVSKYRDTSAMSAEWIQDRKIDVIQIVYSPFNREARPLANTARIFETGVVARECLANGFLSGQMRKDTKFPEGTLNARYSREEISARVDYAEKLKKILLREDITTLPQATYRWVLDQPGVSLALSGAKNLQELQDCLNAVDVQPYGEAVMEAFEREYPGDFSAA